MTNIRRYAARHNDLGACALSVMCRRVIFAAVSGVILMAASDQQKLDANPDTQPRQGCPPTRPALPMMS